MRNGSKSNANGGKPRGRPRKPLPNVRNPNAFARWLASKNLAPDAFAKLIEVTNSVVYGWRKGTRRPNTDNIQRIAEITDGQVGLSDWPRRA